VIGWIVNIVEAVKIVFIIVWMKRRHYLECCFPKVLFSTS